MAREPGIMVPRESDDRADNEITLQSPQWKHVELPGRPGAGRASFKLFCSACMVIARSTVESHKWGCQQCPTDASKDATIYAFTQQQMHHSCSPHGTPPALNRS